MQGVPVRVVDVVDVVTVGDRLVSASFAVFVHLCGVMFCVYVRGHYRSSQEVQAAAASAARAFANAAMLCA